MKTVWKPSNSDLREVGIPNGGVLWLNTKIGLEYYDQGFHTVTENGDYYYYCDIYPQSKQDFETLISLFSNE